MLLTKQDDRGKKKYKGKLQEGYLEFEEISKWTPNFVFLKMGI